MAYTTVPNTTRPRVTEKPNGEPHLTIMSIQEECLVATYHHCAPFKCCLFLNKKITNKEMLYLIT